MELFLVGGNWRPSSFLIYWNFCTIVLSLGWCYNTVVIVYTTINRYNISWCLQTCHLFSRLSILCWLLPCNKYSKFLTSTENMKISIKWSTFESLLYHKLMAHDQQLHLYESTFFENDTMWTPMAAMFSNSLLCDWLDRFIVGRN